MRSSSLVTKCSKPYISSTDELFTSETILARESDEEIPDRLSGGRDHGRVKNREKAIRRAGKRSARRRRKNEAVPGRRGESLAIMVAW